MRLHQIITIALTIMVFAMPFQFAISETVDANTIVFIESRFRLWDANEKMLDNSFNITVIDLRNNTTIKYLEIDINGDIYYSNFTQYSITEISTNDSMINIVIRINNETVFVESNIKIIRGVTGNTISTGQKPFVISLSPLEWNSRQWNIFFAVVISAIISIGISYIIVMRYRRIKGAIEIK